MSDFDLPLPGVDEVRQANRLFLGFLRARPGVAGFRFGLPQVATELLAGASAEQLDRAADFPRALFRICLPPAGPRAVMESLGLVRDESGHGILQIALLQSAWNLSRMSGYSARLLLRLDDQSIRRLRASEMADILELSCGDRVVRAAYDDLAWVWRELLTETRPEKRRRLFLLCLQPDYSLAVMPGAA